ncbi:ester cyclase [Nocardia sp. R7R-8]|uniref:ester cyclase n=1 Tax=Nocardia sp. R7R-8 TaxID=3459304 RepID=UPI00403E025A
MAIEGNERNAAQLRTIRLWAEHWSRHDNDALLELFVTDLRYEDVPTAQISHNAEELAAFATDVYTQAPDVQYEVIRAIVHDDQGSAEWVMRGTKIGAINGQPPADKDFEVRGLSFFEFEGDKIRRCSDYWDLATLMRQFGAAS